MSRRTDNSRTVGGPPSRSDRRGPIDLGWYIQSLEEIQSTTHGENMPVVDSFIENGQTGMTVTANAPAGDLFLYTETYMDTAPAPSTFRSTSPTSDLFFPMNEPDRRLPMATNSFPEGRQITSSHFPTAEIGRSDGTTNTLHTPSFQPPAGTNLSRFTSLQSLQQALPISTSASYPSVIMSRQEGRAPPTATNSSLEGHLITFHFSPEETGRNDDITLTLHTPPFLSTPSTNESEWINYFNIGGVRTRDGRNVIGLDEAVDTQVEPTDAGHRERVMSRIWDTLMEEFQVRSGTTSADRETLRWG
ncbi:hypothetical protein C343_06217 [Cryptococcus neoformans C23]|uniref:Uncharacterized protein n=2 Tax=Cryptococcus neoformans TaxID=5207 RepID=A0A854Q5K2_CRYNE|nr:hypothetical protein CNAG_06003 [Cryptococcus neoformans var. grubii H99]AUB28357.1 hypothetical protein CKF44_06003 [Cryptococcus neoformans var. grubii]OWZ27377.1 hypothetical protein C347_06217 [Cryptococcus neoformans var. grubii AD2-60a]OWZ29949.1 hypothetical protein C353_06236 [Cryptococcus neoformans var. grubii AD1-83a]OWZ39438.1 hypothetical protein C343_06217 [Cryptococcus neoformans var. grubii C23]OXC81637.1 hypothetical protein C344_06120 [Cryptococcus neoformans var. grubii A|eukprot:XP_012053078.1 hypothetical protein CNAG_06003 [Cryptococcus neoformans var. grubii H99]